MRVRAKISFIAFQKRMTISELFCETIIKSYTQLSKCGDIPKMTEKEEKTMKRFIF